MTTIKTSVKVDDASPKRKNPVAPGPRVRTAVKAGKVSLQDFHFTM